MQQISTEINMAQTSLVLAAPLSVIFNLLEMIQSDHMDLWIIPTFYHMNY